MTGLITGTQNPIVGTSNDYEINAFNILGGFNSNYEWHLFKKQKNKTWKDITGTPKTGKKISYQFGEIAIGIEFEIKVYETQQGLLPGTPASKKLAGTLVLIPAPGKACKIDKVILFNRNRKDVNKASYRDTLTAQAHCIAMFGKEIEFHLWEDDAAGKGHDPAINKNNRQNKVYKARVNEKGIAEVRISLMSDEKILRQIANMFLMRGSQNEGANHEYYVTASYYGKIQGASQVNVDVVNPDHKNGQPQLKSRPKPKGDTPKFPTGQGIGTKQPDPKGNILDAVFINDSGKELTKVAVGDKVLVRIHSKNMVGKHIQYVVWEHDTGSHDEIYRSGPIKIPADVCDTTSGFTITKGVFDKGKDISIGDPDAHEQNYFIEIISIDLSAESKRFGVDSDGVMEVENVRSPAVVKGEARPEKSNDDKICEFEARVRAFIRMLRFKEGTNNERGYTTQYGNKQFSNMSKHPEEVITAGKHSSSAAGAYQIMTDTWKNLTGYYKGDDKKWHYSSKLDFAKKYNISSFDQESQDKFCLVIMKHNYVQDRSDSFYNPTVWKNKEKKIHDTVTEEKLREWRERFKGEQGDIIQMIIDNDIKRASLISSLCWASLPDSPYGQQSSAYTFEIVKAVYEKNLKEELIEPNKELHLKKGFLKEFGYGCCEDIQEGSKDSSSKCPDDCSQCLNYSDIVENPKISNQSNNVNKNRFHRAMRVNKTYPKGYYHTGVDILAKLDTDLKTLLCGTVTEAYDTGGDLGKIVTVKSKDKNDKDIWIRYCHLNSISVRKGNKITHGKTFGKSGNTGNAKGVSPQYYHVHIEASRDGVFKGGNTRVDPEQFMKTKFDETKEGNPIK